MNPYRELPDVTVASWSQDVLQASHQQLIVLMFTADWCMPCRLLANSLQQIQRSNVNSVRCCKIDVSTAAALAEQWQIHSLPTLCFFAGGELVDRSLGLLPVTNLQARIDRITQPLSRG